jgi:lipopolysaccharide export system protein LptA
MVVILLAAAVVVLGDSRTLVLKRADMNQNFMRDGTLTSVLKGNVHFEYDDAKIHADNAVWYRSRGNARFSGNVEIQIKEQNLSCRTMRYDRHTKKVIATGGVDFFDAEKNVRLLAENAVYDLETRNLLVDRKPHLFRYDTTAGDTLEILSRTLRYFDSTKIAEAGGDVRISKGVMHAVCSLAYYHANEDRALLRIEPRIDYDVHEVVGDSVDLVFIEEKLRGISVMRNGSGIYREPNEGDTLVSTLEGDSLYMAVGADARLDTIWAYRDAESTYYAVSNPEEKNQAEGHRMRLAFTDEGIADRLFIEGNAKSIYYIEEESEDGLNEASGSSIAVTFRKGKAAYLEFLGDVRGLYVAGRKKN